METIITVDGIETTLSEFIKTNTLEHDVDHISLDDVATLKALRVGYATHIGLIKVVVERVEYRGYTIENSLCPYAYALHFYKTEAGIDCEFDGESWSSNVISASSVQDAKEQIDDLIFESAEWNVKVPQAQPIKFQWLKDAIEYAVKLNAVEFNYFNAM
jgi:hypothetical protein